MFPSAVNSTCVLLPKELSRHVWNQLFHNASFNGCGSGVFAWICVVFFCARHPMKYLSWYQIQIFFTSPPFAVNLSLHAKIWNCNKRHKWSSGIYCFSVPLERCQSFTEVGLSGLKQRMVVYYPRSAEFLKNKGKENVRLPMRRIWTKTPEWWHRPMPGTGSGESIAFPGPHGVSTAEKKRCQVFRWIP